MCHTSYCQLVALWPWITLATSIRSAHMTKHTTTVWYKPFEISKICSHFSIFDVLASCWPSLVMISVQEVQTSCWDMSLCESCYVQWELCVPSTYLCKYVRYICTKFICCPQGGAAEHTFSAWALITKRIVWVWLYKDKTNYSHWHYCSGTMINPSLIWKTTDIESLYLNQF